MTLYQIWDLSSYIAGKFPSGGAIPPARLNLLLPEVQRQWTLTLLNELAAAEVQEELYKKIISVTPLRVFKKSDTSAVSATGKYTLPTDYLRYIKLQTGGGSVGTAASLRIRPVEVVSDGRFTEKQGDVFTRAAVEPFAKITATEAEIVPYDVASLTMDYFRKPAVPVFDYCQDTVNLNKIVYMPPGSQVYLSDALVPSLYSSAGVLLYANVTKSGTYPITSQTVEFEFEELYHHKLVYFMLAKIGLNLSEDSVMKYGLEMEK